MGSSLKEDISNSFIVEKIDGIRILAPDLSEDSSPIWKPLFALLTYREVLNTDTNLPRIFLGNYQDLLSRTKELSHLIEFPDLDEVEIELIQSPEIIRNSNREELVDKISSWWAECLNQLRRISNNRLRSYWKFTEINDQQWDALLKQDSNEHYRHRYLEQLRGSKAKNYQKNILNREKFLKRLETEILAFLESEIIVSPQVSAIETPILEDATPSGLEISRASYKAIDLEEISEPLEDWLRTLSSGDRYFVDELLSKFNQGEKVAPFEFGLDMGLPRQKTEYFFEYIKKYMPAIYQVDTGTTTDHFLELVDSSWLLIHGDDVTHPVLKYMYENQKTRLSAVEIQRIFDFSTRKTAEYKIKKWAKRNPKLQPESKKREIPIFRLDKSRLIETERNQGVLKSSDRKQQHKKTINCPICKYGREIAVFKGKRPRGTKWFCLASDPHEPKEITILESIPRWCPLEDNSEPISPACITCQSAVLEVQQKRVHLVQYSCQAGVSENKVGKIGISCSFYKERSC